MRLSKYLVILLILWAGSAFGFDNANILLTNLDTSKIYLARGDYYKGAETTIGCADCSGTADFIWECNDPTVGDTGYSPCGCSSGDSEGTANSDATISSGVCVFDDVAGGAGSDGQDYYAFDVSSDDIFDDTAGTIFIRFKVDTWVAGVYLWSVLEDANNEIHLRLVGTDELYVKHEGNSTVRAIQTADANLSTGTEYIARVRWRTADLDPNLTVNVYNTSMVEQGSGDSTNNNCVAFSVQAGANDFKVGNATANIDSDINIYYPHIYSEWLTNDPN